MAKRKIFPLATTIVVTITNGVPSLSQVDLPISGRIAFVNLDSVEYLIELWNRRNDDHVFVGPVLPANGSLTFCADLTHANNGDKCFYNVLLTTASRKRKRSKKSKSKGIAIDGGGHVIIIGK
ncbi:hypothetical protein Acid345_3115 [Candidatus Koribacter versatilis Ellin345]|uniref:Uncharacterized protein n=1 Tax=Koribacter versatilis (strain Ellin345) TaxID=204669 RepID=Q1ILY4_KORVE|nr:hypothetical protein [Candidatus Koribacter versatilis]ABF42116.1 hypothetical protein Acid345_3115 [Candidatus Koribacter versatilis Ellin345]